METVDYMVDKLPDAWKKTQAEMLAEGLDVETLFDREVNYNEGWKAACEAAAPAVAQLRHLLRRYRNETPPGHQPHMIAEEVDKILSTPLGD